jgi:hypothetical protein
MEEGLTKASNIVGHVTVQKRYGFFVFFILFHSSSFHFFCPTHFLLPLTLHCLHLSGLQSDEQCCNSCEEVREAYKKKGWALTNPDLIDQVHQRFSIFLPGFVRSLVYIDLSFWKS